jgi:hypothetical protein
LSFSALAFPDADIFAPATPSSTRFSLWSRPSRLPYPHAVVKAPVSDSSTSCENTQTFQTPGLQTFRTFNTFRPAGPSRERLAYDETFSQEFPAHVRHSNRTSSSSATRPPGTSRCGYLVHGQPRFHPDAHPLGP